MTALPPVPYVVKARLIFTDQTDTNANVNLHFSYLAELAPLTLDNVLAYGGTIAASYGAHLKYLATAGVVLTGVDVTDLNTDEGVGGTASAAVSGANAVLVGPQSACMVFGHQIAPHYRGGKPRSYFPFGWPAEQADGAHWSSSFLTGAQTYWDEFISDIVDADSGPLLAHVAVRYYKGFENVAYGDPVKYRRKPVLNPAGVQVNPISGTVPRAQIGSQRRRLGKR